MINKSVSLVLSSGGARGVAHIGVIEGLLEHGFDIASISGSSMGAVVGGVYAAGKLPEYKEWVCNLDKIDVFKLLDFTLSTQGFVRGERVFNEMKKFISDCNIEELEIPFAAVATDIVNKKEVVFESGSLYTALRASAAIPSVMTPSIIENIELVDGGVCNPLPINHVKRAQSDILVVCDVNADVPSGLKQKKIEDESRFKPLMAKWNNLFPKSENNKSKRLSMFELFTRSVDMMQDAITEQTIMQTNPEIVVRISREACGTFEFHRSSELIEYGKREFVKSMKSALQRT